MKDFRDLYIDLNGLDFNQFIDEIKTVQSDIWKHEPSFEEEARNNGIDDFIVFKKLPSEFKESNLWLSYKNKHQLKLINIVPESGSLSCDEYNNVLMDFVEKILIPVYSKYPQIKVKITLDSYTPQGKFANDQLFNLFSLFSKTANKSTGSNHPLDRKRWQDFIREMSKEQKKLDPDYIEEILIQDGWPEETAIELRNEYEFGLDLLNDYQMVKNEY